MRISRRSGLTRQGSLSVPHAAPVQSTVTCPADDAARTTARATALMVVLMRLLFPVLGWPKDVAVTCAAVTAQGETCE